MSLMVNMFLQSCPEIFAESVHNHNQRVMRPFPFGRNMYREILNFENWLEYLAIFMHVCDVEAC